MFNQDQCLAADEILTAHHNQSITGLRFLIDGPGGTRKTYLSNSLCHLFMGHGIDIMSVSSTGIAASLLPEGRTVHSRFKLPVPILETSTFSIRTHSKEAEEIKKAEEFIWNKASMAPSSTLKALDILLRDIMNNNSLPCGGKIMVVGSDFRQVVPVLRLENRSELIAASVKISDRWSDFKVIDLNQHIRTEAEKKNSQIG